MGKIEELTINIVEYSNYTSQVFEDVFSDCERIKVWRGSIKRFFYEHEEVDCLVSPANAFGLMTGGYDAALSGILGWDFQESVQEYIREHYYGEQVVGTSFYINTPIQGVALIHTPTMQYPSIIKDDMVVYHCMRSTLICALQHDVKNIVIPAFGVGCGEVDSRVAAEHMKKAYLQIVNRKGPEYRF